MEPTGHASAEEAEAARRAGFGAPASAGILGEDACVMLAYGSPKYALVRAHGIRLHPWAFNIRATFDTTDAQAVIPDQGADAEIVQDVILDAMVGRVIVDRVATSPFDSPSDYAFNFVSAIEIKLQVTGRPSPSIFPEFTPLANAMDVFNGDSKWGCGWILTQNQGLKADFTTRVAFPDAPVTVVLTFRAWQPVTDMLVGVTDRQAVERLRALGYVIPEYYLDTNQLR